MAKKQQRAPYLSQPEAAWGWVWFLVQLLVLPTVLGKLNVYLKLDTTELNLVFYGLNFLAVLLIFHSYLLRSLTHAGGHFWDLLKGCILGLAVNFAGSYLLAKLMPGFSNVNDSAVAAMLRRHFWPVAIATVAAVPLTEELFFRGLIFRGLRPRRRALAYILSTLAFCAVHVVGYVGNVSWQVLALCFIQYIPAGLGLAWAVDEADNIYAGVLVHSVLNLLTILSWR